MPNWRFHFRKLWPRRKRGRARAVAAITPVPAAGANRSAAAPDEQMLSLEQVADLFDQWLLGPHATEGLDDREKRLARRLDRLLRRATNTHLSLPHLPSVVPQLIHKMNDPGSSARQVAEIVRRDPAITAEVLRVANSAYYQPAAGPIGSIDYAIVHIGYEGMRTAVCGIAMKPMLMVNLPGLPDFGQRVWAHAPQCANACRVFALRADTESFAAYLLGLLSNSGRILVFQHSLPFLIENQVPRESMRKLLRVLMRRNGGLMTHAALTQWGLPDDYRQAAKTKDPLLAPVPDNPLANSVQRGVLVGTLQVLLGARMVEYAAGSRLLSSLDVPAGLIQRLIPPPAPPDEPEPHRNQSLRR